jgi:DNA-binding MarR family transcriptional regulator
VAPLAARWIERLLGELDPPLTVTQFLALRAIARENVSGTDLALRAGVSGPAVSQLVAGLVDAGLVERETTPDDRRRHTLALSATGKRTITSRERHLRERLASLLDGLPHPEADALSRALPQVESALSGSPPPRRPPPPHKPKPKPKPKPRPR